MINDNYIQLLRHATLVLKLDDKLILVDPMLSSKGQLDPVANCGNDWKIPMVDLPITDDQLSFILKTVDAVLITHIHRDHWDIAAQRLIPHDKKLYCQPSDAAAITHQGFTNVSGIEANTIWNGWQLSRTGGQHGTGDIGRKMGNVSGFVLSKGARRIYVAGDTIWCNEVADALKLFRPTHVILNTGGARFLTGDPITMTTDDVLNVRHASPDSMIIAVHMDTVNHCFLTRELLREQLIKEGVAVVIPADGETLIV